MAAAQKQLNEILGEFGKQLGLSDLALDEDGFCCINFDEAVTIVAQCDDETERLVLSCEICPIGLEAVADVCVILAEANFGWMQTGGIATLSMAPAEDGEDSRVVALMSQSPLRGLDSNAFQSLYEASLETAEAWQEFLQSYPHGSATAEGDASADAGDGFMRV